SGIPLQDIGQIAVVPTIVDHLDNYCIVDTIGFHQIEKHLGSGVLVRWTRGFFCPGIFRVLYPHVHVRIDHTVLSLPVRISCRSHGQRPEYRPAAKYRLHTGSIAVERPVISKNILYRFARAGRWNGNVGCMAASFGWVKPCDGAGVSHDRTGRPQALYGPDYRRYRNRKG